MSDKEYNKLYTVNFLGNVIEGNPIKYLNVEIDEMKKAAISSLKMMSLFGLDAMLVSISTGS